MENREQCMSLRERLNDFLAINGFGAMKSAFHGNSSKGSIAIVRDDSYGGQNISVYVRPAPGKPSIKEFHIEQNGSVFVAGDDKNANFTLDDILNELGI